MSTIEANSPPTTAVDPPVDNYLTFTRGFKSWALTLDHKRIGVMYLFAVLFSFFVGGVSTSMAPSPLALLARCFSAMKVLTWWKRACG